MTENDRPEPHPEEAPEELPAAGGDPLKLLVGFFLPIGILALLLGITVFLVMGEATATFLILFVVGAGLIALSVFYNADRIGRWIVRRGAILVNVVAMTVLATVLLVIVGYLNEKFVKKLDMRRDLTRDSTLALSDRTKAILRNLEDRLTILHVDFGTLRRRGLDDDRMVLQRVKALLDELERTSGKVVVYTVTPLLDPEDARATFGRAGLGTENLPDTDTLVLAYDGNRQDVSLDWSTLIEGRVTRKFIGERVVTTKILELTSEKKNVYFLKGHDEKTFLTLEDKNYQEVNQALRRNNFEPVELNLARKGEVPEDCTILVIAGPKVPLAETEVAAVDRYLERGGSLLFLVDPEPGRPDFGLNAVLRKYGIVPKSDFMCHAVLGQQAITVKEFQFSTIFTVPNSEYTVHPVVDSLRNRFNTAFFGACPVDVVEAEGVESNEIIRMPRVSTSGQPFDNFAAKMDANWRARLDPERGRGPSEDAGDIFGRMSIAAAAERVPEEDDGHEGHDHDPDDGGEDGKEKDPPRTRIVVIGDSDFCLTQVVGANARRAVPANLTLFVNAIQWLGQRESYISIEPKTLEFARERADVSLLEEDDRKTYERAILWIPLLAIPAFVAYLGLVVWWRRQR